MNGSIQKRGDRPDRPWRARYRGGDGRERSRAFVRRVDAERWLRNELARLDSGQWVPPEAGRATFAEVATRWQATRQTSKRPSTTARDQSYLRSLILPTLGRAPVAGLRPSDLQAFVELLTAQGKAAGTVLKAYQITASILRMAVRDRLLSASPAIDIQVPQDHREEVRFLTADQVLTLAGAIDHRYTSMVLLGGFGGLRFGEVAGLQVGDLNLLGRRVTVRRTLSDVSGTITVGPPKTATSRRTVMLPALVVDRVAAHLQPNLPPEAFIFTDPAGGPIRRTNWTRRVWKPAVFLTGLSPLRFHDLRHSHVAMLIAQGEHPRVIADRLGHSSARTVLDVYGHLLAGTDEQVAERLDGALAGAVAAPVRPSRGPGQVVPLGK